MENNDLYYIWCPLHLHDNAVCSNIYLGNCSVFWLGNKTRCRPYPWKQYISVAFDRWSIGWEKNWKIKYKVILVLRSSSDMIGIQPPTRQIFLSWLRGKLWFPVCLRVYSFTKNPLDFYSPQSLKPHWFAVSTAPEAFVKDNLKFL